MSGRALVLAFTLLAVLGHAARVLASEPEHAVPAEVLVILGSTEGSGDDPQLEKLEALRKPPFDALPKKVLLKRVQVRLELGKEEEVELPNGRKLHLTLLEKRKD
ncbi:MAG TPA: hypothetical protein VG963_24635, partial [Polyangiaceae bacterium]|nr:hypothetical protein [Polyangiaceae bacterium]